MSATFTLLGLMSHVKLDALLEFPQLSLHVIGYRAVCYSGACGFLAGTINKAQFERCENNIERERLIYPQEEYEIFKNELKEDIK